MKQSDHFRENAENCQRLAERATDHPTYLRYKRMEDAWLSLADEQDWLDGETPPGHYRGNLTATASLYGHALLCAALRRNPPATTPARSSQP